MSPLNNPPTNTYGMTSKRPCPSSVHNTRTKRLRPPSVKAAKPSAKPVGPPRTPRKMKRIRATQQVVRRTNSNKRKSADVDVSQEKLPSPQDRKSTRLNSSHVAT